ncbi:hypothetical protein SRHO_G00050480 [Serrasalmus rhombeus]
MRAESKEARVHLYGFAVLVWTTEHLTSWGCAVRSIPRLREFQKLPDTKRTMGTLPAQSIRQTPHSDQTRGCCFL